MPGLIHSKSFVEWVAKPVETRYRSESNKKAFTALKRSTNHLGSMLSFKALFLTRIESVQLSRPLNLRIFRINQVEDGAKYLLNPPEKRLAQELLSDIKRHKKK